MAKWYVEFKVHENGMAVTKYIGKIEAEDGKAAIEYVKEHTIGAYKFHVWHDDEED